MTRIIFVLLIILSLFISYSSSRRILHQPFFPVTDSPPPPPPPQQPPVATQPPSLSPSHSPSPQPQHQSKHPFSSLTPFSPTHHHNHDHRFFPFYTTPPTTTTSVPSTSLPTFPANISSIVLPSPSKSHVSKKLLFLSLTLSLLSIGFIAAVVASLLYHRNHNHKPPTSDSLRLFPANLPTSEKPPPFLPTLSPNFSTHSSEFLYLGTLVSPLHDLKTSTHVTNVSASTSNVVYDRMGSPELRPLPPLPRKDVYHQNNPGVKESFFSPNGSPVTFQRDTTAAPPSPPPPPPPEPRGVCESQRNEEILKPKLKGLHWDKIKSSSEKAMVWDQLKSSSFQVNEEMIETLFMANSSKVAQNQTMANSMAMATENNRVLDPHKSRNIAILLRAFNLTIDEVCECILQGNVDTLGSELLESLLKMAPTNEEEARLKEFNYTELDPAERFLKAVIDIPFAFKRVDAMLYLSNFDTEVEYYKGCFETIKLACEQLRNSRMLMKLLEAVLMAGNRMNIGTNRGDAHAFKLDTLLKLIDIKGTDGKTTLLHFVVQEIARAEGGLLGDNQQSELCDEVESTKRGLEVVSGLGGELSSVKKAASMDFDLLLKEVGRLAMGLNKISEVIALNEQCGLKEGFVDSMNMFLKKAEGGIGEIEDEGRVSISMVKETTEYFHGSLIVEEGQRLWIFMVVRDFLSVLDRVCKEVGKMNERTTVGSQSLPSVFAGFNRLQDFGWFDGEEPKMA